MKEIKKFILSLPAVIIFCQVALAQESGPPHIILPPFEPIQFEDAQVQSMYEVRCQARGFEDFQTSALAAEGALDALEDVKLRRGDLKRVRRLVLGAVEDHRKLRSSLFECLSFLRSIEKKEEIIAQGSSRPIDFHSGMLSTVDGRIISILQRMNMFLYLR